MEIDTLRTFRDVVEQGSFAAAARARGVDPSAVSRHIAGLEATLSLRLFERTTRRLSLTEAGRAYFDRIAPVLLDLDAAADAARALVAEPRGRLQVSASTAFGEGVLVPMLPRFQQDLPGVDLHLALSDQQLDLIGSGLDLAIRLSPEAPPDTVVSKLMPTRYHVVASPDYLTRHPLTQPKDLSHHACLRFPFPGYRDLWRAKGPEGITEVPVTGQIEITGAMALRAAACQGLGPALLADWMIAEDLALGRLVDPFPQHRWTATGFDTAAWLLYPSRAYLPAKTRRFIDLLRDFVSDAG